MQSNGTDRFKKGFPFVQKEDGMKDGENLYASWHSMIEHNAGVRPDKPFIESLDQDKRITFGEMNEWCNKIANLFQQKGLTKDDRVTLISKNSIEAMIIYFGTLKYGAILNPIFSEESEQNLYRIVNLARPTLILHEKDLNLDSGRRSDSEWIPFSEFFEKKETKDPFSELLRDQTTTFDGHLGSETDIAEVLYTSGTTSVPKGILISREALFLMTEEISERTGIGETDRVLEYRAYNWASAQLLTILSSMLRGNTLFLAKKFSRTKFPEWLKRFDITVSSGVPAVFSMLVNEPVNLTKSDVPSLRYITSSSAPLPEEIRLKFEAIYGIRINQMMGMSEAGWMAANPPAIRKAGSVGLPLKYKEVFFLNTEGERCGPGEIGEMAVAGKSLGMCYLNEDGTRTDIHNEGFLTGDLGYMDEEGYIFITGRKKELIIRGGINISPMEINSCLLEHPAVCEAATVGAPDKIYGEEVVCFVTKKEGFETAENELILHCRKRLPDFKIPKKIIFVPALPRNQRAKVTRSGLLKLLDQN